MILALDTATRNLSIALFDGQQVDAEWTWRSANRHTIELIPAIRRMMDYVKVSSSALTGIAVATGPGSFTGLRIGMSAAKGIALSNTPPTPLIGIPTLDIVAVSQPNLSDQLLAISQAGRGRINTGHYRWVNGKGWQPTRPANLTTWTDLTAELTKPIQIAGEIDVAGRQILETAGNNIVMAPAAFTLRRAGFLAQLAYDKLQEGQADDPSTLAPIYLQGN